MYTLSKAAKHELTRTHLVISHTYQRAILEWPVGRFDWLLEELPYILAKSN